LRIAFEAATGEMMLRCRVIQALEVAAGPDWQTIVKGGRVVVGTSDGDGSYAW
jgi:hypothetical protein